MTRYNKLWAALAIAGVFVAMKYFHLEPAGVDQLVVQVVQGALTAWGVYQVPNAS